MSKSARLTPGHSTAVVLGITAAAMLVTALILSIMAANDTMVISPQWHFGFVLLSLLAAGTASTFGAAAMDGLFVWPKGGSHDPPPYTRLPSIEWRRASDTMTWNFYIISIVLAVAVLILTCMLGGDDPTILFSPWFHAFAWIAFLAASGGFLLKGAAVEDRHNGGKSGMMRALLIISFVTVVVSIIAAILGGNDVVLLSPEFHFGFCIALLATSGLAFYGVGRVDDRGKTQRESTSLALFVVAAAQAVTGGIIALIATSTVLFSTAFHAGAVILFVILAGCTALYAALLKDRDDG